MKKNLIKTVSILTIVVMMVFCTVNVMAVENSKEKTVGKIEIKCESFAKNDSTENSIECGSASTFSATVKYSDGTIAKGDDGKVNWSVVGSNSENNIYTKVNDDNSIYIYAPYHYSNKLTLTATSGVDNKVKGNYQVEVFDKHNYGPSKFFNFIASVDDELTVNGNEPTVDEKWDLSKCEYSITAPENTYKIDGYTFLYWQDEDDNNYNVGDKITVKTTGTPSICNLYGVWKSDSTEDTITTENSDEVGNNQTTTTANKTSTPDEYSLSSPKTGDRDMLFIVLISVCLATLCGVCVYKIKK